MINKLSPEKLWDLNGHQIDYHRMEYCQSCIDNNTTIDDDYNNICIKFSIAKILGKNGYDPKDFTVKIDDKHVEH